MNSFYVEFLERNIRVNEEFANLQESDCYRENCKQNDKVMVLVFLLRYVLSGARRWLRSSVETVVG